jgi:hypothetical protein
MSDNDGLVEAINIAVNICRYGLGDTMKVSYSPGDPEYSGSDDIVAEWIKKPSVMDIDSDVAD